MATYYLKNTSGTVVALRDLGIVLPDNASLPIDSNDITGWLTPDMADALNTPSDLILSTTDLGDSSGDLTPDDAILALSLVTRYSTDNPTKVTFTQSVNADPNTDITAGEAEELTNGSDTSLHIHDNRYYTETELSTPNPGTVVVHWDNIVSAPDVGAPQWQEPVLAIAQQVSGSPPTGEAGDFYMDTDDNHLYKYDGTTWVDQGAPQIGDRFADYDTDDIYEWDGSQWNSESPEANWSILVQDDGDEKGAQYVYDGLNWTKIADVDWGTHSSIGGRDVSNSHPSTAISYNNSASGLSATNVQAAIDEVALEGEVDISNLLIVSKNGSDTAIGATRGTFANPYGTIQAAINAVPTSGGSAATADNPYLIMVMPGQYEENVNTSKEYAFIAGWGRENTIITSATGDTVTLANTGSKSSGLFNITIESTSADGSDNVLLLSGNNPQLKNVLIRAGNGARTTYVDGSYNYTFNNVDMIDGTFRIDNGTTDFFMSSVSGGQTVVTNGSLLIRGGKFRFANGDVISQSGGSVRFINGKITSNNTFQDYNQTSGSVAWGWIDCDESKLTFNGTYELIFKSIRLAYNNSTSGLAAVNVQAAIDEIDNNIDNVYNDFNTHVGDITNPHSVTFTQAVTADAGTDITVTEAEILTDGSNADALHHHDADNIVYGKSVVGELDESNVQSAIDYIAKHYRVDPSNVVFVAKNGSNTVLFNDHQGSAGAPYLTISAAINRVEYENNNTMDNPYLIWIAPGLYEEDIILNDNRLDNIMFASNGAVIRSSGDAIRTSLLNGGLSRLTFDKVVIDGNIYFEGAVDGGNTFESICKFKDSEITGNITGKNLISLELEDVYFDGSLSIENVTDLVYQDVRHESGNTISLAYNSTNPEPVNAVQTHMTIRDSNVKANLNIDSGSVLETFNSTIGSTSSTTTINGTMVANGGWLGAGNTVVNAGGELVTRGTFFNKPNLTINSTGVWNNETKSDVVFYDNTITQIPADNVQDAIDNLKAQVDAFKIPKGTSFPTTPEDADLFYRTDLSITYQYDGSRNKWLSTTQMTYDWGSNNADGKYLNIHGAAATMSGYLMPRNGTIIALTAKIASGNQTKSVEIRRNHDTSNPLKTFTLTSGSYSSVVENIDFQIGDYLQAFVVSSGAPARDVVVVATIAWGA